MFWSKKSLSCDAKVQRGQLQGIPESKVEALSAKGAILGGCTCTDDMYLNNCFNFLLYWMQCKLGNYIFIMDIIVHNLFITFNIVMIGVCGKITLN